MNGRCQKDALDRADDICELCGHQFCAACLLFPRGHRNPPTCKTCALEHSGLRGGSTKRQAISKREYKKRKKALFEQLEEVGEQQPAIEYFELNDPSKFDRSSELDRRTSEVEEAPTIDILAASETPQIPSTPTPAPPNPAPTPAPRPTPPAPEPEPVVPATDDAMTGWAPVDTSVNPLALGGAPKPAPTPQPAEEEEAPNSSAADLLARLKADQPIQSQFTAAPVGFDTDPFAASTSDLVAPPQHQLPTQQEPPAAFDTPAPMAPADTRSAAPREPQQAKSEDWSPPSPPPRGSNLGAMSPEPVAGQSPTQHTSLLESPFETPTPVAPDPEIDQPARRKADTDESGQWIPPSLRGMATPDERDPLPKRRS